jgi:hypothetical protein
VPLRQLALAVLLVCGILLATPAGAFDLQHAAWTSLLTRRVQWSEAGAATSVDHDWALNRGKW